MSIEISTVGASVWTKQETTAGTAPGMLDAFMTNSTWAELKNVNSAPGLSATPSTIDASNITDKVTRYIAGRIDPGGIQNLTMNLTADGAAITDWDAIVSAYTATPSKRIWVAYVFPSLKSGTHYTVFRFPIVPLAMKGDSGISQNSLKTIDAPFIVDGEPEWFTTSAS